MENVVYINLLDRTDRMKHVENQLKKIGVSGTRMNAVQCIHGAIGCGMSHIQCLELAKEKKWNSVCIVEDDIEFTDPVLFLKQLETFMKSSVEWDVLLLATNMGPPFIKETNYLRVFNAQTTTGYIVKQHYYDKLIDCFKKSVGNLIRDYNVKLYSIDIQWKQLQKYDQWYVLYPLTVIQRDDYSNIENKNVSYKSKMLKIKE